jgi:hypothetical protein
LSQRANFLAADDRRQRAHSSSSCHLYCCTALSTPPPLILLYSHSLLSDQVGHLLFAVNSQATRHPRLCVLFSIRKVFLVVAPVDVDEVETVVVELVVTSLRDDMVPRPPDLLFKVSLLVTVVADTSPRKPGIRLR